MGKVLGSQRNLFFECPKCGEVIIVPTNENGDTFLHQLMKESKLDEINLFSVGHDSCGFSITFQTADQMLIDAIRSRNNN